MLECFETHLATRDQYDRSPFPLTFSAPGPKAAPGQVRALFGLHQQGKLPFVERAVAHRMGWQQIAQAIGWVSSAACEHYLNEGMRDTLDSMGLWATEFDKSVLKGRAVYDPQTHALHIAQANGPSTSPPGKPNWWPSFAIENIQFRITDAEKFEASDKRLPPLHIEPDYPVHSFVFHTRINPDENPLALLKCDDFWGFMETLLKMTQAGYTFGPVYYDDPEAPDTEKGQVSPDFIRDLLASAQTQT